MVIYQLIRYIKYILYLLISKYHVKTPLISQGGDIFHLIVYVLYIYCWYNQYSQLSKKDLLVNKIVLTNKYIKTLPWYRPHLRQIL